MKKFMGVFVVALLLLSLITCQPALAGSLGNDNFVEGELIISFENNTTLQNIANVFSTLANEESALKTIGVEVLDSLTKSLDNNVSACSTELKASVLNNMGSVYLVKYDSEKYSSVYSAISLIKSALNTLGLNINYVEPNMIVKATEIEMDNNSIFATNTYEVNTNQAWHYNMIKAPDAWDTTIGSASTVIAVLDTGVDYDHINIANYIDTERATYYEGTSYNDGHGHGTHCCGTVASYGTVSGVMRTGTILPIKVLSDEGSGSTYNIQQGVLYAAECGVEVISMSLGGGSFSQSFQDAINTATNSGVVVVAASGNEYESSISYPAAYDNVIAVGALTSSGTRASYSNYGTGLDVMAPGSDIYSLAPNNSYTTMSGTSMATPHVAGVVGLIRSANPDLTPAEVTTILFDTCVDKGNTTQYGNGCVDAQAACLTAIGETPVTDPDDGTETPVTSSLTVSLSLSSSYWYSRLNVTATVTDQDGNAVSGASVAVTIKTPDNTTATGTLTTNSSGQASGYLSTSNYSSGTYTVSVQASMSGYADSDIVTGTQYCY